MQELKLQFEDALYSAWIGCGCVEDIISKLSQINASSYCLITDENVYKLHADTLHKKLSAHGPAHIFVINNGEEHKNLSTVERVSREMVKSGVDRESVIVAVGGGMVGNLAGVIAGLMFRGVRLVHVPTTLIAAGDAVASLKQAVNIPEGKNLLGCFHTPIAVFINVTFLQTLPVHQTRSGMCEIIKNALAICDDEIHRLESTLRTSAVYTEAELMFIVESGIRVKQKVMKYDKFERNQALVFEYGHTVGHAIELAAKGRLPHGEAVGLGMLVAAEVSSRMGLMTDADRDTHHRLLSLNGLTPALPAGVTVSEVMKLLRADNKRGYLPLQPDQVAMILLSELGRPAGPPERPLSIVTSALVKSSIEQCLTSF